MAKWGTLPLRLEVLEDRTVMSVLPTSLVSNPKTLAAGIGPQIAIDPINPRKMVVVAGLGTENNTLGSSSLTGQFTRDGGQTWSAFVTPANLRDPNIPSNPNPPGPTPYQRVTASIAFDRTEHFYIVESERSTDDNSGAIVLSKYDFSGGLGTPVQVRNPVNPLPNGSLLLYRWFGQDPALNPVVAVDNNLATFTDPQTGFVQTDTMAALHPDPNNPSQMLPKGVFVAWNVNYTNNPPPGFNTGGFISRVEVVGSGDGGVSFTPEQAVSTIDDNRLPGSSPQIAFTQGTPVDPANPTTPRVRGGLMVITWSQATLFKANPIIVDSQIFLRQTQTDNGIAAAPAVGVVDAVGPTFTGILEGGAPTIIPVNVNVTDPNFSLSDLTVSLSIKHPHISELNIQLVSPGGVTAQLLLNRVDSANKAIVDGNNNPIQGLADSADLGYLGATTGFFGFPLDTVFDDQAIRSIHLSAGPAPYIAHFRSEGNLFGGGTLSVFNGMTAAQLTGQWKLIVTDVYDGKETNPPPQFVNDFALHFSSYFDTNRFGLSKSIPNVLSGTTYPVQPAFNAPYPYNVTPDTSTPGVSPGIVVASDNTLGSFSPYQGRMYIAYTSVVKPKAPTEPHTPTADTNIALLYSDDGGNTWTGPIRVNDDSKQDGTEGIRSQFMPSLAVDQITGTVVVDYYDGRLDPSRARLANSITTSIDGGQTFSPSTYLNVLKTAIDVATNQTVVLEPIPGNQAQTVQTAPAGAGSPLGFGSSQGLVAYGGHVYPVFASNLNTINPVNDGQGPSPNSFVMTATVNIAAGPRIIQGDEGAIFADFSTANGTPYNNTFTSDGTRQFTGFVVTFDRPVDPATFTGAAVTVEYRDTVTPLSSPPNMVVTGAANFTVTPVDQGSFFGPGLGFGNPLATQFLVRLKTPLSGVGTYSYAIAPLITDRIRSQVATTINTVTTPFSIAPNLRVPPVGTGGSGNPAQDVTRSTINVAGLVNVITKVTVNVKVPHTFSSDLIFRLFAPDGTLVLLSNREGSNARNSYANTTFDDGAGSPVSTAPTPYLLVSPETPLSALNGMTAAVANGAWRLEVEDAAAIDTGTLLSWSLNITTGLQTTGTTNGNVMDQNANAVTGENPFDSFATPRPLSGIPFQANYDQDTLPLIIPGPHVIGTSVPGAPARADNRVINGSNTAIDVTFDRIMDATTFTPAAILRMVGPLGAISGPFTVTPIDLGTGLPNAVATQARTFRIGFPLQFLSGSYAITISPAAKDVLGHNVDSNLNAGLAVLRGVDPITSTLVTATAASGNVNVALPANGKAVESDIIVTDVFPLQGITVQVNITKQFDPDLTAVLIAPDGSKVTLFSGVGAFGLSGPNNFQNTTLDDNASAPVQLAPAPLDGTFNPQESLLNAFLGHPVTGTWKLLITNTPGSRGALDGVLNNWTLKFQKPVPGTGLGEVIADQFTPTFRIFTQDPSAVLSHTEWTAVGPASENSGGNSGRISALALDPSDPSGNTVYLGGASGGVWKTSNFLTNAPGGPTYIPLTDLGPVHSLNMGSIAVFGRNNDPNQSIIFVATGEGDTGTPGVGFLRSMDGGKTWGIIDSINNNVDAQGNFLPMISPLRKHGFVGSTTFKVIVDPTPQINGEVIVYAAVSGNNGGVWRSNDTGKTWVNLQPGNATDVVLSAASRGANGNLTVLFAAIEGQGIYYTTSAATTNPGLTFRPGGNGVPNRFNVVPPVDPPTQIPVSNPSDTPNGAKGRISLAVPALANNPARDALYEGWLYAIVANPAGATDGLYMTKDFGLNWTKVRVPFVPTPPLTTPIAIPTNDEQRGDYSVLGSAKFPQGNYNQSIVVDSQNPNIVFVGGTSDGNPTNLIRVDTTILSDPYALVGFDNSDNDGGLTQRASTGTVSLIDPKKAYGILTGVPGAYINLLRDPTSPFDSPSSLQFANISRFNNTGGEVKWQDVGNFVGGTDHHRAFAFTDPLTGHTRFVFADDQGIWSSVDKGNGTLDTAIGTMANPTGSRNGNLQIIQLYSGASHPSVLAADIAGSLFYGMAQDDGFPASTKDILTTGELNWTGPEGDGTFVATDQTGSGTAYFYKWPCCGANPLPSDFFLVNARGGGEVSKITGLLQAGDDPGNRTGQWPFLGGSRFAVNPIDPTAVVMSSQAGRIFRTSGPSTGALATNNQRWFPIGDPSDLDGTYANAMAFGAPSPSSLGVLDDFIYAGTSAGNVFVTFTGGGVGTPWKRITGSGAGGLDGSSVMDIVTDPKHGSHALYAVTLGGVYFMADSSVANPQWIKISGNLFSATLTRPVFGDTNNLVPALKSFAGGGNASLTALVADWRFAIPDDPLNPNGPTHPVLYVGSEDGVFRSIDKGATWKYFPHHIGDGSTGDPLEDGGHLANTGISQLGLTLGNINPATGLPDQSTGLDLLTAYTYGRGAFAIRMDNTDVEQFNLNHISGPAVVSLTNPNPSPVGISALRVLFSTAVDPVTFTTAKINTFTDPSGNPIDLSTVQIREIPNGSPDAHNLYEIDFPLQTARGFYHISFGPRISDFQGDLMNQNGNAINGEPGNVPVGDAFVARILFQPGTNSAPVLGTTTATFPAINEDDNANQGTDLKTWVATLPITDADDPGASRGVAITAVDDTNGTWQYSQDSGTTWKNIPAVSNTNALLLEAVTSNRLRFVATGDFFGNSSFTFRAWDLTSGLSQYGSDGGFADTSSNGGSTAFSSNAAVATIQVRFVNDVPMFTKGLDQTPLENGGGQPAQTVPNWATNISPGPANEASQTVSFTVTNDNNALFTVQPTVSPTGTLSYQLAQYAIGTATVTVKVVDSGGTANGGVDTSAPQTFKITITPVNQPPSFTKGPDQTPLENGGGQPAQTVPNWAKNISAGPPNEAGQTVHFVVTNDDNALFAVQPTVSPTGTLSYQLAQYGLGTATVTVKLVDDGGTANGGNDTSAPQTFLITVTAVNQPPTFKVGPDQTTLESKTPAAQTVSPWATNISPGPLGFAGEKVVKFTITGDDNPSLFSVLPAVAADGTLTYTAAVLHSGTANITLVAMDNGGTANGGNDTSAPQTFRINVTLVNQPPSFTGGPDETVLENGGSQPVQTVPNWATNISPGVNQSNLSVHFIVTNDDNALFAVQPTVSPTGTLTFQTAVDAVGSSTVTVILQNSGGTANGGQDSSPPQTFHINVTPVNQPPSFTPGPDQAVQVSKNPTVQTVPNWATNIKAGPPNEAGQAVTFVVSTDNPSLFLVPPSIAPNGTLTYQPTSTVGTAHVTVFLKDDGGTANGGNDTFGPVTFTISVNPAPAIALDSADALWVISAFHDFLKRAPRPDELAFYVGELENGSTRLLAARQMTQSDEYRTIYLTGLYSKYFGRTLDANGRLYYLNLFKQGATAEEVKATIFESDEYFRKNGGTNFGFLSALYRDVLGVPLDEAGRVFWGGKLAKGVSPHDVALAIVQSQAADSIVVQQGYPQYLGRTADAGAGDWTNALLQGTRDEYFYAGLVASAEYGLKSSAQGYNSQPDQSWLNQVFLDTVARPIDANGAAFFIIQIRSGARRGDITQAILGSGEYRTDYVQGLATTYLGHPLDGGGVNFYTQLLAGGATAAEVKAELLQSDEYFNRQQQFGAGNYGYLVGLFRDVLGKNLDEGGRVFWGTKLAQESRHDAVLEMLQSSDGVGRVVQLAYPRYLSRAASGNDVSYWTSVIQGGTSELQFYAKLFASHEYYVKA